MNTEFWDARWKQPYAKDNPKYALARSLMPSVDGKTILDFGAGNGNFFDYLVSLGCDKGNFVAHDASLTARTICSSKGYQVSADPVCEDFKYDVVVLIDVLEHSLDPATLLGGLRNIGHEFVIVVPNFSSLKQRMQVLSGAVPFQNRPGRGGHVYWFNDEVLENLIQQLGMQILQRASLFPGYRLNWPMLNEILDINRNLFANSLGLRGGFDD